MSRYTALVTFLICLLMPAWAGDKKQASESGITREQGDAILNELRQIRELLEKNNRAGAPAAEPGKIQLSLEKGSWIGKDDAPLTIVEFTDYQCGFCQRFHMMTFPELKKKYIDSGKVRFASRDFPLEMHSNARRGAVAARCAGEQDQFWQMRDILVANSSRLSVEDIRGYAEKLKLDTLQFETCMRSGKFNETIKKELDEGLSFGVDGTPSFIIGKSTPEGVSGVLVVGALPLAAFDAKLKEFSR